MNKQIRSTVICFKPAKQFEDPKRPEEAKQFTTEELEETKAWLQTPSDKLAQEHAREERARKAALRRHIRTCRQKLQREAERKGFTPGRKKEIESNLENLNFGARLGGKPRLGVFHA